MASRKIIGITFSFIGILFSIIFLLYSNLNIDLKEYFDLSFKSYFSLSYFNQILPLINCFILLYSGILLITKPKKSNPILALFGFTILEEIVFHWFGIISINFPNYIVAIFFASAILALWIAYSNNINQEKILLKKGIFSLILGTTINAISYGFL